ncbi:ATP-grasp domain-containing protein [Falsiroseomonas sp. CW058]|uniref:ATP-grasp domain-containing protein n=1 Tax=Falsiroseomonas sp. CW058 TaxID=3388664 RepID=UPI003D3177E4
MPRTVLLTLGRLPKALDLARGFAAEGWRVVVAEPHARHLCGASRSVARSVGVPPPAAGRRAYLEALAAVVREEGAELVIPVSEEALHVAHLPALLGAATRVLAMPPDRVLEMHDKARFVDAMRRIGVPVPDTAPLGSAAARGLAARGRVVVKPVHSCSGRGVRVLAEGAALPEPDPRAPAVVQRFVAGEEFSSCTLAHGGRVLGTAVYRGVQFGGTVAIAFERVAHPAVESWIDRAVAGLGWSGFISFDLRVDASGRPFGIECNPRTTSGLHFLDPRDLVRAILSPADAPPIRFRPQARLQQFWSCLTETQLSLFRRGGGFGANLRHLLTTPDACWNARDPWPLLSMPWTAWPILREAARRRVPFGEVATLDVGWFEGEDLQDGHG